MPNQRRAKDTGAFFQRADGKWVGVVELPPHPDGRRRRKKVVRRSKREAENALKALRTEKIKAGGDLRVTAPKTGEWVKRWIDEREKSGRLRPRTAQTYHGYLARHIEPHVGRFRLDQLTPTHVERMTAAMIAGGTSPTSALQAQNVLKGALKAAERKGLVDRNAASLAESPEKAHTEAETLPYDEARRLLGWAWGQDAQTYARIVLAVFAGLRQAEALGLTRSCIDLDRNVLIVKWQLQRLDGPPARSLASHHLGGRYYLTEPKSKAGLRIVPLLGPLRDSLEKRLAEMSPDPWALVVTNRDGGPLDPSKDRRLWMAALDDAGVRRVRLHDARHTAGTLMRAYGIDTRSRQRILGHSSAAMSEHYAHELDGELAIAMAAYGAALSIEPPRP